MDWYVIDKEYISYLSKYDYRLGFVDYGNRLKIHIGILFSINGFQYYVPVSSAKPNHQKMSNGIDFYKIIVTVQNHEAHKRTSYTSRYVLCHALRLLIYRVLNSYQEIILKN